MLRIQPKLSFAGKPALVPQALFDKIISHPNVQVETQYTIPELILPGTPNNVRSDVVINDKRQILKRTLYNGEGSSLGSREVIEGTEIARLTLERLDEYVKSGS